MLTVIAGYAASVTLYSGRLLDPLILTADDDFPAQDVAELIAYGEANPGKVTFGSSAIGPAAHLTTELLKQTSGIDRVARRPGATRPARRRSSRRRDRQSGKGDYHRAR